MGFGHRVYKNFDPRARIIKSACDVVLEKLNIQDPLLDIAKGLEEEALKDQYFVDRKLSKRRFSYQVSSTRHLIFQLTCLLLCSY